jgi:hypothetical protein
MAAHSDRKAGKPHISAENPGLMESGGAAGGPPATLRRETSSGGWIWLNHKHFPSVKVKLREDFEKPQLKTKIVYNQLVEKLIAGRSG